MQGFNVAAPTKPSDDRPLPVRSDDQPPAVDSRTLLGGHRELKIEHGSEVYRLRLTSNNKLILIK